tara:strand:+ start:310 stop:1155 length:846 start_codon:yes stop_codon:yes gene_type:complete
MFAGFFITLSIHFCFIKFDFSKFPNFSDEFRNKQIAESFIYSNDCPNIIFAGSSLTGHLPIKGENIVSFGLANSNANYAMEAIQLKKCKPDFLFLEIDGLYAQSNTEFKTYYQNDLWNYIYKKCDFFHLENRPFLFLSKIVAKASYFLASNLGFNLDLSNDHSKDMNKEFNALKLGAFYDNDFITIKNNLKLIENHLSSPLFNKTQILFYEVPLKKEVANSKKIEFIRKSIKEIAAENKNIKYIQAPILEDKHFKDGIHLKNPIGKRFYEKHLLNYLEQPK